MNDRPLDKIHIRKLFLRCILGINEEERRKKQDVVIDITLHADLSKACLSDNMDDTVNYKVIKEKAIGVVEDSTYFLVEALAERLAAVCLENPRVERVDVTVDKPGALRFASSVGVEIVRFRAASRQS